MAQQTQQRRTWSSLEYIKSRSHYAKHPLSRSFRCRGKDKGKVKGAEEVEVAQNATGKFVNVEVEKNTVKK